MTTRFAISDHHFMHKKMYVYTDVDGNRVRPWAQSAEEADEMMIDAHNKVVRPGDTVYFIGDIAINAKGLSLLTRMAGRKILIRGNHDIFRMKQYTTHFADIRGSHKLDRMILTHYPMHPGSIPRWCIANLHGHTHGNDVTKQNSNGETVPDPRYYNACVESMGLFPRTIESIEQEVFARQHNITPTE